MKNFKHELGVLIIFFLFACAVSAYFFLEMQQAGVSKVPVHWNIHNEADLFASPLIAALIGPVAVLLIIIAAVSIPGRKYSGTEKKSVIFIIMVVTACLVFINWVALQAAAGFAGGKTLDISLLHLGLGILFVLIGNRLGKLRPSYWVGIRLPATLNNEEVWNRVHRKSGRLMVFSGLCVFIAVFFGERPWVWIFYLPLFISILLMIFVIPALEKKKTGNA
ncbi:MAG: SdpI family protein [Candidatus Marinimicrobia bacterium]|nr:SdpI family protein [Candidatus Neomarinimicrobiota bacterium]